MSRELKREVNDPLKQEDEKVIRSAPDNKPKEESITHRWGELLWGIYKYKQIPNIPTIIGLLFIIIGVIIVNTMNSNQ